MPRAPHVSPTSQGLSSSVFEALRLRARDAAGDVHPLHVGDTWREPPEAARSATLDAAGHPLVHCYAPTQGEPGLLDAIGDRLARRGGEVPRPLLQVVAGATSGLSVACQSLLDPGDEVLIPTPCWPLITGIVASRGAVPVQAPVMTSLDNASFDLEAALERHVTPRTAALYLNTPHNPTGRVLSDRHLEAFEAVAARHSLWVLSDEVYEDLAFVEQPAPAWRREGLASRSVSVHSVSKAYGMAGARVGWAHGSREAMEALRAVHVQQVYCAPRPMQVLAARALAHGDAWQLETRALYARAARQAAEVVRVPVPDAGTFLFFDAAPHLRAGEVDALPFLQRCLDAGVLLTPGAACGRDWSRWVRLCFTSVSPAALDDALERLAPVLTGGGA